MKVSEVKRQREHELRAAIRELLRKDAFTIQTLHEELNAPVNVIKKQIGELQAQGLAIVERTDERFVLERNAAPGGHVIHVAEDRGDGWAVAGFTADNHLGSKHERLDVLHSLYDIFEREGVHDVYQAGNMLEGESRVNRHDIKVFGMEAQGRNFVENWPERKGIVTHFVTGNDHEGWYAHREQVNIGLFLQRMSREAGRHDLNYLGNIEADVELVPFHKGPSATMKVLHGGGGNAYALSYVLQKTVEAFQGGEKPTVVVVGHHHKFDYCYPRNVHAFMPGCTEDQSIFMRSRKIEAHVGGVLAKWKQDRTNGNITQFELRWIPFYDRGFYQKRFE